MKRILTLLLLLPTLACAGLLTQGVRSSASASGGGGEDLLVSDGFESGDRSYTENGFTWETGNTNVSVVSSIAHTGTYSLRFSFGSEGAPEFAEQRWEFDGTEYDEIWISWYQYFPDGTENPSVGPEILRTASGNNKLIRVFAFGETVGGMGSETFPDSPSGDEQANLEAALTDGSTAIGGIDGTQCFGFLSDTNRGRWFQVEFYFRPNQSHTTPNGAAALYIDGALCSSFEALDSQITPTDGIGAGYIGGHQNGGYVNATSYVYVDDFKISVTGRTGP